jgi:hypothetical protein
MNPTVDYRNNVVRKWLFRLYPSSAIGEASSAAARLDRVIDAGGAGFELDPDRRRDDVEGVAGTRVLASSTTGSAVCSRVVPSARRAVGSSRTSASATGGGAPPS